MPESVNCNLCGTNEVQSLYCKRGLRIVRCEVCGLVYVSPRALDHEHDQLYAGDYFFSQVTLEKGYTDYMASRPLKIATFEKRLSMIGNYQKAGRILDVGCATGFFLQVAKDRGWEPYGVDVSIEALVEAQRGPNIPVVQGTLERASFRDDCFDAITMFDVIEHLPDPIQVLREAHRILKENGILVICTPDVESFSARLMGRNWPHLKPSEHLYYFSKNTLPRMLDRAGFHVLEATGIAKTLTPRYLYTELARTNPILSRLLRAFSSLLLITERAVHIRVGEMMAIASKS